MNNSLLLSIHPEYARMIFEGTKKVELRKICPRRVASEDYVFVYVTSPIQMLIGYFEIEKIIAKEPEKLWQLVKDIAGISYKQYSDYFERVSNAYGIYIKNVQKLVTPLDLTTINILLPGFRPPQGYLYLSGEETKTILQTIE